MRQLRYVQPGDESELLIVETADGAEQFTLPVDETLRDAVRTDPPRSGFTPAEVVAESTLGPREIQVRVRAGADPQELAAEHRLPLEKIMRFAGPVLEERIRIAEEARRARARRTTTDGQPVVFGETVDARFAAHGIDAATVRWDSRRRDDGQWLITATWLGGTGEHSAEWAFQLASRHVAPVDDAAADLLSDKPIRPFAPSEPVPAAPSPLAPGVFAFPAMPNAHTGPLPKLEEVFDQEAPNPDAPRIAPVPASKREPRPAAAAEPAAAYAELPLPLALTEPLPEDLAEALTETLPEPPAATAAAPQLTSLGVGTRIGEDRPAEHHPRARHRERSKVPTWDDIMLGVRRKQD
jgi:hypothetical protein